MATHFIFLPGMFQGHRKLWLQSMESQRVGYRAHPGPFQFHARISLNFRLRHGQLRVLISHLSCQYFSGPNSASGILWGRDMWSNTVSSMSNMQVFNHFLGNLIIYSRFHKENWLSLYWFFFFLFLLLIIFLWLLLFSAQPGMSLCDPMDCSTLGFPVLNHEFAQTHPHQVSDAIQPSHPLPSHSPPAFNLSQHQGLSMSQLYSSGVQIIGVSASAPVLPMNIQG